MSTTIGLILGAIGGASLALGISESGKAFAGCDESRELWGFLLWFTVPVFMLIFGCAGAVMGFALGDDESAEKGLKSKVK